MNALSLIWRIIIIKEFLTNDNPKDIETLVKLCQSQHPDGCNELVFSNVTIRLRCVCHEVIVCYHQLSFSFCDFDKIKRCHNLEESENHEDIRP
jgi:hypothetical protein